MGQCGRPFPAAAALILLLFLGVDFLFFCDLSFKLALDCHFALNLGHILSWLPKILTFYETWPFSFTFALISSLGVSSNILICLVE